MTNFSKNELEKQSDWSFASQDILESLPKVWTRGLLYFLVLFVGIGLPWAILSKVDETGKAQGRLEPKGRTIRLDSPVTGTVTYLDLKEGDSVKKGQTLVEIESEVIKADLQQQNNKLEGQENRSHQLLILRNQLLVVAQTQQQQNQAQKLEKIAQVNQAEQNIATLKKSYDLQKTEKLTQVNQAEQNLKISRTAHQIGVDSLEIGQKELKRYQDAAEEGIVSQIQVVDKEDALQERIKNYQQTKSDITQAKLRLEEQKSNYEKILRQAQSEIEQAQLKLREQKNSYDSLLHSNELSVLKVQEQLKNLDTDITILKSEIKQTRNQIQSLKLQLAQRVIKSPVDGTVFSLTVGQKGSVLQASNKIIEIAPKGSVLILRAQMITTESGSLKIGMPVKIKLDAYPFQDYGIIEGELTKISPTTAEMDTAKGKVSAYELEIQFHQTCLKTDNNCIPLRPGDTATAEVILRQRRIIDFILDPFKKIQKNGLEL